MVLRCGYLNTINAERVNAERVDIPFLQVRLMRWCARISERAHDGGTHSVLASASDEMVCQNLRTRCSGKDITGAEPAANARRKGLQVDKVIEHVNDAPDRWFSKTVVMPERREAGR
jgi:hypothetical protein